MSSYAFLWQKAGKAWADDLKAMTLLGITGWSSRLALNKWLITHDARLQSEEDGVIKRLWKRMEQRGLVEQRTVTIDRQHNHSVAMVWLTENGRSFLWEQGVPYHGHFRVGSPASGTSWLQDSPCIQPWLYSPPTCSARHGFFSEVCPVVEGRFAPDLRLFDPKSERAIFVEVEAPSRGGKAQSERLRTKWNLMENAQGYVALCALNPKQRGRRMISARAWLSTVSPPTSTRCPIMNTCSGRDSGEDLVRSRSALGENDHRGIGWGGVKGDRSGRYFLGVA